MEKEQKRATQTTQVTTADWQYDLLHERRIGSEV